jgi:hypothetical protein
MSPTKRVRDTAGEGEITAVPEERTAGDELTMTDAELAAAVASVNSSHVAADPGVQEALADLLTVPVPVPAEPAPVPEHHEAIVTRLRVAGALRARLQSELDIAEAKLNRAIEAAHDSRVPKRAIAREAGVVRQTVYNVLARREAGQP